MTSIFECAVFCKNVCKHRLFKHKNQWHTKTQLTTLIKVVGNSAQINTILFLFVNRRICSFGKERYVLKHGGPHMKNT
jgi:hypothetical protein